MERRRNKVLIIGILLIFLLLAGIGSYFFVKTKRISVFPIQPEGKNNKDAPGTTQNLSWETYTNENYKYSLKYSPLLVPREIQSDAYLNFVIFYASVGTDESGFAISVRENSLEEEISLIKKEIQKDVSAKLKSEDDIVVNGFPGKRLNYEPEKAGEGEPRTIIIINNGNYSYSLSSRPEQIDELIANFELLNNDKQVDGERVYCQEPRPEVCTEECILPPPYICGSDGKLYCSACQACSNSDVDWYLFQNDACGT